MNATRRQVRAYERARTGEARGQVAIETKLRRWRLARPWRQRSAGPKVSSRRRWSGRALVWQMVGALGLGALIGAAVELWRIFS